MGSRGILLAVLCMDDGSLCSVYDEWFRVLLYLNC